MKTIFNEWGAKIQVPDASNAQSSVTNFKERQTLDDLVEEEGLFDQTVDIRVQRHLYGRIDYDNNGIYPNADKVLFSTSSYVFGFDFTNTAIDEFNEDWASLLPSVPNSSVYKSIQTSNKNYRDITETFRNYYVEVFGQYHLSLFTTGRQTQITDFDSYVAMFANHLIDANIPFTRENLIKSLHYQPDNTLLVYNLQEEKHGNDEKTFQGFYLDEHISLMAQTLLQHGFVLDRHSPWRFVINLKAPQFAGEPSGKTLKTIFDNYYIRAYTTEVVNVVEWLVTSYNNFVTTAQQKTIKQIKGPYNSLVPVQCKVSRDKVSATEDIKLAILNFLINVREAEEGTKLPIPYKQNLITLLGSDPKSGLQLAYEKLHFFIKNHLRLVIKPNMSHPDALSVANHLGCQGATFVKDMGWIPCKTKTDFATEVEIAVLPQRTVEETLALREFKKFLLDNSQSG
tara:strand:- start:233 stop:1597 length:1365 start_codon:yes stop_codon:yes gene_type:complete